MFGFKTPEAPATIARAEAAEALDRSWTEGKTRAERFDAFRALPEDARAAWLGHAVARTLEASLQPRRPALLRVPRPSRAAARDRCGALVAADRRQLFRPGAEGA